MTTKEKPNKQVFSTNSTNKAVVFTLNSKKDQIAKSIPTEEEYAINISQIREIINYDKPTRLPGRPNYIMGVLNVRGEIIPLLDLGYRLNYDINYDKSKIIITYKNNEKIGLIVQSVKDVIDYTESEIEEAPATDLDFVIGLVKKDVLVNDATGSTTNATRVLTLLNTDLIVKDEDTKFELVE